MPSPEPIDGRCAARVTPKPEQGRPGGYCTLPPLRGQARCRMHGGAAAQNKKAAERRLAEEAALRHVARYGQPVEVDAFQASQEVLATRYGNLLALRDLIASMEPEALTWGASEVKEIGASQFPGVDITKAAGIAPIVELYERQLRELAAVAHEQIKIGVVLRAEQRDSEVGQWMLGRMLELAAALGHDASAPDVVRLVQRTLQAGLAGQGAAGQAALPSA